MFCISILGEHEPYEFPEKQELQLRLKDMLEDEVDEKFYLSEEQTKRLSGNSFNQANVRIQDKNYSDTLLARDYKDPKCVRIGGIFDKDGKTRQAGGIWDKEQLAPTLDTMQGGWRQPSVMIKNATKKGYIEAKNGDGIDLAFLNSDTRRGRVQNGMSQTLDTGDSKGVIDQFRIRKLTPLECWRLMGISDEDFYKAEQVNSNTQLYKQAGNAIVVDVLEGIFKQLFNPDENNLDG